jgi:hypothetical protein
MPPGDPTQPPLSDTDTMLRLLSTSETGVRAEPLKQQDWFVVSFRDGRQSKPFKVETRPEVMAELDLSSTFPLASPREVDSLKYSQGQLIRQIATHAFTVRAFPGAAESDEFLRRKAARDLHEANVEYTRQLSRVTQSNQPPSAVANSHGPGFGQSPQAGGYAMPPGNSATAQTPQRRGATR